MQKKKKRHDLFQVVRSNSKGILISASLEFEGEETFKRFITIPKIIQYISVKLHC